jgi:hypothetical protein
MDVAIVVVYSVLSVAWLAIDSLRAQSIGQDGATWYLRTHLCALGRQLDCDECGSKQKNPAAGTVQSKL